MVSETFPEDMKKMVVDGLIVLDSKGEMKLTEKGMKQAETLLKEDNGAKEYMKQVAKHFSENKPDKETVRMDEIADEIDMVDNTKLNIYERFKISENDDLKNYQLFCKLVESIADDKSNKNSGAFEGMLNLISDSKYFEIPDNVNLLLQNTSNNMKKIRLPHFYVFLDVKLVVNDRTYYCMQIQDRNQFKEILKKNGMATKDIPDGIDVLTFYENEKGIGWEKIEMYDKSKNKYRDQIKEYILNFADFVNSEDVKLMFRQRSEKNTQRRIERGRLPLPSFNKIQVIGYLGRYLKQLELQEASTRFSHRFWVRGHFKRFWDKERYKNLYDKFQKGELKRFEGKRYKMDEQILRVWVYPYIKGEGMLIEKEYKLK